MTSRPTAWRARALANVQPPPRAAELGNRRAVRHGANSEAMVAPLRATYAEQLRAAHPDVTDAEITIQATRLARVELVGAWIDREGIMHRGKGRRGDGWGILRMAHLWETQAERWYERRREEQEARRHAPISKAEYDQVIADAAARTAARRAAEEPADAVVEDADVGEISRAHDHDVEGGA